ncbi:heat resistant agglutinin 1 precursor [Fulvimarina pelagi HTCC2506]|uniref:Heat resistant agglutinin 1 n=2 Tax=Fulvimarina pelagi TaxID=217511 RepID=Q0FZC7_9HYPH|nr:outer membrane protein [Fulvimarina pelagi]EAU40351.1 heat resistant agglutinin 1 precursor [Fulvimarina pelagi HTCC2506]BAT31388.1 heat resistant agglutinin 1 precursor [Fulvimarina pelagi]
MKKTLLTTVAALGALAAFPFAANAADLIEEAPVYVEPPVVHQPKPIATAGWYLRGDVGYVFSDKTRGRYKVPYHYGYDLEYETYSYDEIELEESFLVSGGVGYRFNDFARLDFTADYFSSDLRGTSNCVGTPSSDCRYDDRAETDIWVLMANAYADLGTYGGITPYVGGGLGFAHVSYGEMKNEFKCGSHYSSSFCGITLKHGGKDSWRFAYGLTVGASYDLTANLKFDAGYKWTHINDGEAFGYDELDRAAGASGTQGYDNGFDIHTVRAGLRYEFGGIGKEPAPVYSEPAPIYDQVVYK